VDLKALLFFGSTNLIATGPEPYFIKDSLVFLTAVGITAFGDYFKVILDPVSSSLVIL